MEEFPTGTVCLTFDTGRFEGMRNVTEEGGVEEGSWQGNDEFVSGWNVNSMAYSRDGEGQSLIQFCS